jgi:hypothetical protein
LIKSASPADWHRAAASSAYETHQPHGGKIGCVLAVAQIADRMNLVRPLLPLRDAREGRSIVSGEEATFQGAAAAERRHLGLMIARPL